jgi:hypothetical protein
MSRTRLGICVLLACALPALAEQRASMLHTPPMDAALKKPLTIEAELVNGDAIQKVFIRYRGPAEEWAEAPMELKYGDLYRGEIPAAKMVPPGIEYYLEGVLANGTRKTLFTSAANPTRVFVLDPSADAGNAATDAGTPRRR